ncbi:cyclin-dependent kinase 4 inhibitor B [Dunckerocampus dactyliophorus]|uniref:cyclin-dependent kinase 4 inhibitor B n=1 Tax=Dunckerocampus dactyliophorus TaxID=161453 RepID=UPI002404BE38|nr:cyclin-dependent kinase 4 inhibitor B [Dunckerocampus dactyliophorus]
MLDAAFGKHGSKTKDGACVSRSAPAAAAAVLDDDVTHSRQGDKPRHITRTDSLVRRTKQLSTHFCPLLCGGTFVTVVVEVVTMTLEDDLTSAAAMGNTAEVERLLRAGADVNAANRLGHTALQAMMMGSSQVARLLLARGANPNVADSRTGTTPLHDAARTGFADTVRLLVCFAADPQARDHTNCRPVDVARTHGHADIVAFLEALD